jgi:hypothetical protein
MIMMQLSPDETSSNFPPNRILESPIIILRYSSWMYRRNIIDLCKKKINLDLDVQLLQGILKFAQVSGRDCITSEANICDRTCSQFISLFFFVEKGQIFSESC